MTLRSLIDSRLPPRRRRPARAAEWGVDPFTALHHEMNRLLDEFAHPLTASSGGKDVMLAPRVDMVERDGALTVTAELPGVEENAVDITLHDGALVLSGEKSAETTDEKDTYLAYERSYGAFRRVIPLGFDPNPDDVRARFAKGVLTITIPKPSESPAGGRKVEITSAD
ncbi:MAG: Hsp20/alpha crystallin family protein [Caulobacterales bacterium]|nr:Hsp20/alpha crystallin family protein [Caulobacterales bacterium]